MDECVVPSPESATPDAPPADARKIAFAKIKMDASNQCPMLSEDRLCRIQSEHGHGMLSHTCATYPRVVHTFAGAEEKALTLSCPEAARVVLLSRNPLAFIHPPEIESCSGADPLPPHFWAIRDSVLKLVRNRAYPIWQRVFLLGLFSRRLDSIASGELKRSVPDFLSSFSSTVATGSLRPALETLPVDRPSQLDVVLRLAGLLLHRSNIRPRFVECVQAFTAGIGNGPGATIESLTEQYSLAHDRYYEPFLRRHPPIMENYLVNTIVRCQFPFGKDGMKAGAQPSMAREFTLLTVQFALTKGLLIGVAGFHREAFSPAHVVHTVQSAAKHFEHHPEFLNLAHALLVESEMNSDRGISILLRNARPAALPEPIQPPAHAPGPLAPTAHIPNTGRVA
jgi:lysine-N-methylase